MLTFRVLSSCAVVTLLCLAGCGSKNGGPSSGASDAGDAGDASDSALAAGFPAVAKTPGRAEYSFLHDGLQRQFVVYVPKTVKSPAPVMIVLHGGGGSAAQMFTQHPLEMHAEESGYIMVAAQGTPKVGEKNSYDWNGQVSLDSGVDDVGYLARVITELTTQLSLDAKRRYLAGFSGGASMTIRFGAERAELLTAIGTFAGKVGLSKAGGPFEYPPPPKSPISVQLTYGTEDENYAGELKGDIQATSAKAGIAWWVSSLSCTATPTKETSGKLTIDGYPGCLGGSVVRMVTVEGMRHTWPEKSTDGLDGTKLLLNFFADKVKP